MEECKKLSQVRKHMKEIDTLLYEIVRDYRVSGHPMDNTLMRELANATIGDLNYIWNRCTAIKREALKSPITGK